MKPVTHYRKNLLFLVTVLFSIHIISFGQTITGVVSDSLKQPLLGATVEIKGTSARTSTNAEGAFSLNSKKPLTAKDVIVFTFTGYKNQEVSFNGNTNINIQLQGSQSVLNEVVVTALGIKRAEKSLGYSAQTVSESAVKDAKANNWVNTLSGKVTGLNIQGTSSEPMGSSRITLRGE